MFFSFRDTLSCHDDHLCLITFKSNPTMNDKVMGRTQTGFTGAYE